MINELILRRGLMGTRNGIDWATIGHGMVDFTTQFSVPAGALPTFGNVSTNMYAFIGRGNLTAIDFTNQLYIPSRLCQNCTGLTSITIPTTVTRIGDYTFYGCSGLTEVICENSAPTTLGASVFDACTNLASIYVPDASVSTYQGTSQWSTYASIIKPISQRPT